MHELYFKIFFIVTIAVLTAIIVGLIIKFKKDKQNANRQIVYVSTLKVSYCGVGGLITSFTLIYDDDTYEKSLVSKQKLMDVAQKINSISDKELVNIEDYLVIAKDKFIATELGSYTKYK
jgi:hypothetical protein